MTKKIKPPAFRPGGNPAALVAAARRGGNWRPTVVMLVRQGKQFLVVKALRQRSRKDIRHRIKVDVPKGGVERWQTPLEALCAELREEVGVSHIASAQFLGSAQVPFGDRPPRDGYRRGKLYLLYLVVLPRGVRVYAGRDHRTWQVLWRSVGNWANFFRKSDGKFGKKGKVFSDLRLQARIRAAKNPKVTRRAPD